MLKKREETSKKNCCYSEEKEEEGEAGNAMGTWWECVKPVVRPRFVSPGPLSVAGPPLKTRRCGLISADGSIFGIAVSIGSQETTLRPLRWREQRWRTGAHLARVAPPSAFSRILFLPAWKPRRARERNTSVHASTNNHSAMDACRSIGEGCRSMAVMEDGFFSFSFFFFSYGGCGDFRARRERHVGGIMDTNRIEPRSIGYREMIQGCR